VLNFEIFLFLGLGYHASLREAVSVVLVANLVVTRVKDESLGSLMMIAFEYDDHLLHFPLSALAVTTTAIMEINNRPGLSKVNSRTLTVMTHLLLNDLITVTLLSLEAFTCNEFNLLLTDLHWCVCIDSVPVAKATNCGSYHHLKSLRWSIHTASSSVQDAP